jgi:hypothetical protein
LDNDGAGATIRGDWPKSADIQAAWRKGSNIRVGSNQRHAHSSRTVRVGARRDPRGLLVASAGPSFPGGRGRSIST